MSEHHSDSGRDSVSGVSVKQDIPAEELPPVDQAGITAEDRKEILAQIEEVATRTRVSFKGRDQGFRAAHSGFVLPVIVNLLAVAVCASGIFFLSRAFSSGSSTSASGVVTLSSVEGRLIQKIKQEAESSLKEKESAISDLRTRLEDLDRKKASLVTYYEGQLRAKEEELRVALQQELARERERLMAQGLADVVIQQKLKDLESRRNLEIEKELTAFRAKLAGDKVAEEARLSKLRDDYGKELTSLNEERKRIQEDAKKREEELRASYDAKLKEQATLTESAGVAQAKAELSRLANEQKELQQAEDRIVALYARLQGELNERRYNEAAETAASLRRLLNEPSIVALPGLAARRSADLFAADYLERNARLEVERSRQDGELLARQADLLASIKSLSDAGNKALSSGDAATAEARYNEALALAPEILVAHRYFEERSRATQDKRFETASKAAADALAALKRDDYDTASSAFGEALSAAGVEQGLRQDIVAGLARGRAPDTGEAAAVKHDTEAATLPISHARRQVGARAYSDAIQTYLSVLVQYPSARQRPDVIKGIEGAFASWSTDRDKAAADEKGARDKSEADLKKQLADLQTSTDNLKVEVEQAKAGGTTELSRLAEEKDAKIRELELKLVAASRSSQLAAAESGNASGGGPVDSGTAAQPVAISDEQLKLIAQGERLSKLREAYLSYSADEDRQRAAGGAGTELRARSSLDSFLDSEAGKEVFPDFRQRLSRYEKELAQTSTTESLRNAASIAESAMRLKDTAARERYLADLSERYKGDADMQAFIDSLRKSLK